MMARRRVLIDEPIYIGLDLSVSKVGITKFRGDTLIEAKQVKAHEGLTGLARAVWWREYLVAYCRGATMVAIEDFAHGQAMKSHEIGGVAYAVRIALVEAGLRVLLVPIATNKRFTTGKGNSNKHAMVLGVYKRWGYETDKDDVADSYGLSKCARAFCDPQSKRDEEIQAKCQVMTI